MEKKIGWKNREITTVLRDLAVNNFDLTRKIAKIILLKKSWNYDDFTVYIY